jgi:hypothetical protein
MLNKMANAYDATKMLHIIANFVSRNRGVNPNRNSQWLAFDGLSPTRKLDSKNVASC